MDANQLEDFDQSMVPVDDVNRIALSATRSRLYIDCADVSDEATYTCVAENAYSRISSHTKLNLIRPAVQLASPAMGGDENDLSLSELGGATLGQAQQPAAQLQQSGVGNSDLALTAVPQCLSDRVTAGSAPQAPIRIHMWTHNIVEIMKNNVIIYCRSNVNRQSVPSKSQQPQQDIAVSGMTPAQMTTTTLHTTSDGRARAGTVWTLPDDKLVSEDLKDKYEILETGDLLIKDLRWSDMGSYVCTVSDERGSDSVSTFVYPASVKINSKRSAAAAATNWNLNVR